jgi:hypothetical protein
MEQANMARSIGRAVEIVLGPERRAAQKRGSVKDYFLRWRIFDRMRRFLRPSFRRPLPDFLTPKAVSVCTNNSR